MKTLDELFAEISENEKLQEKLVSASGSAEELLNFLREQGCEADISDIKRKLSEISDDELDNVSGGAGIASEYAYNRDRRNINFSRSILRQVNDNLDRLLSDGTARL